ncbi:unnamed protein product [Zymoseptoria tritici ST99CH_1E4]|uniref:Uncharacterized protein n=1 Tax=Zymoseptoria tritici ST99CH_1E4 TaxID=1276532 RepID=A0A2H1G4G3_ZYMTR|nr:unnamed protein product [Zymoseptoria tritici ST99CH_1E4]
MTAADVDYIAIEEKVKREFSLPRAQEIYFSIPGFDPTACNKRRFAALIRQYVYMPKDCRPYFHLFISAHDGEMRPSVIKLRDAAVNERQGSVLVDMLLLTPIVVEDNVKTEAQNQIGMATNRVEEEERLLTTPQAEAAKVEENACMDDEGELSSPQPEDNDIEHLPEDSEADVEDSAAIFIATTAVDAAAEAEAMTAAEEDVARLEEAGEDGDVLWIKR